ncbi:MAG TPA: ATP-binding protein [Tepidisphaeraceae bacterium]|jgi:signal transduction histidine kinase/ActR/RegA family two-component response regulator
MTHDGMPVVPDNQMRVLVIAPTRADAQAIGRLLGGSGITCMFFANIRELCSALKDGVGAIIISEEAATDGPDVLAECVRTQSVWSDIPIIVLSRSGAEPALLAQAMQQLGNVSVVERPVRVTTLVSLVKSNLRARQRQYQVREYLAERDQLLGLERSARADAERNGKMKDEFLATLSHELRTPLNSILGWSQLMRETGETGDLNEGLQIIERNARAQTKIIEDLLDMSRIISGKVRLDIQPVDLAAAVHVAIENARPAAQAKNIRLEYSIDPSAEPINGDPNRLQQVLWNLLSNSVKFTPADGRITVALKRIDSSMQLRVADTGEGIDPEFLPHVFDRFRQADGSTTRRHSGLGLGLSIVRQLVELHGGTITARSDGKGKGATFEIHLPIGAVAQEQPEISEKPARPPAILQGAPKECSSLRGIKVLVVDDEPDARLMMRRFLEGYKAVVLTSASASEALDVIKREKPDVVVSDIGMPGRDGYELIRELRSLEHGQSQTPAIALTAYARTEDRIKAINAGFQLHLSKPVEPAELITVVASVAHRKG